MMGSPHGKDGYNHEDVEVAGGGDKNVASDYELVL